MTQAEGLTPAALAGKDAAALAGDWLQARGAEEKCKAWRIAVEEALDKALGHKAEGAKTHKVGYYSVTLTGVLNRKLDKEKWEAIKAKVPEELRAVVKYEPKLDEKGAKWIQEERPDVWRVVAQAVTTTPGKTGVKVVRKEEA